MAIILLALLFSNLWTQNVPNKKHRIHLGKNTENRVPRQRLASYISGTYVPKGTHGERHAVLKRKQWYIKHDVIYSTPLKQDIE